MENKLTTIDSTAIVEIKSIVDISTLLQKIKQIDALKSALESCNRFHENAIKYAQLEAVALIRVCELNGLNALRGRRRETAKYLHSLTEKEREQFISLCSEGITIEQVFVRDIYNPKMHSEALQRLSEKKDWMVETLKEEGIVTLDDYGYAQDAKRWLGFASSGAIDEARKSLRKAGAVAIGRDGIYVMPKVGTTKQIADAVTLRLKSIVKDLEALLELVETTNCEIDNERLICCVASLQTLLSERNSKEEQ